MNLNDILQSAQGGAGLQNLGAQFGLSPEQTQAAVQAIIPAISHGLQRAAQDPGALSGVVGEIASGAHAGSYADPAQAGAAADAGTGALGRIFGGEGAQAAVAQQIARVSGLDPALVASLLPAVTSMALGGLAHVWTTQAQTGAGPAAASGGLLGSLVTMVTGALGGQGAQGELSSLINMFAPGVAVPAEHAQALNQILPR